MNFAGGILSPDTTDLCFSRPKIRALAFSGAGIRLRRSGTPVGKSSALSTPFLNWKFHDPPVTHQRAFRWVRDGDSVSVRKLAAALWRLRPAGEVTGNGRGSKIRVGKSRQADRLGFEREKGYAKITFPSHLRSIDSGTEREDLLQNALHTCAQRNGILTKVKTPLLFSKSAMEEATMWDRALRETSNSHVATASLVNVLQEELVKARTHIQDLEAQRQSSKIQLERFLRKLHEEYTSWQKKEHQKIHTIADDLKVELYRERKNCQRMQKINSQLVNELGNSKLYAKRCFQGFERERKSRVLMEEVCNELAKEIAEDKAELEALKKESRKRHKEMEEERKMLQLAEVWREERVQMKLVDAKLALENKYSQLNELIADLEDFLASRTETLDSVELRKAELIQQEAMEIQNEFSYVAPNSYDVFSIVKELQNGETNEREIEAAAQGSVCSPECSSIERDENGRMYPPKAETVDFCSVSAKQLHEKASSVSKIWEIFPRNGEINEIMSAEPNRRLSNVENISPDSENEYMGEAVEKCHELPRGTRGNKLKSKLWEARKEARKFQLHNVLEQQNSRLN